MAHERTSALVLLVANLFVFTLFAESSAATEQCLSSEAQEWQGLCSTSFVLASANAVPSVSTSTTSSDEIKYCEHEEDNSTLLCTGQHLVSVPVGEIPDVGLSSLTLAETGLRILARESLTGKNIRCVRISHSPLYMLENGAFHGLSGVRRLELTNNAFQSLAPANESLFSPFESLLELEVLHLDANELNLSLTASVYDDRAEAPLLLPCLTELSLRNNPLTKIDRNFFSPLRCSPLKKISLRTCDLQFIHNESFSMLPNLQVLDLFNNYKLFQLSPSTTPPSFKLVGVLQDLDLGANSFVVIPYARLEPFNSSLRRLSLSNNMFNELGTDPDHVSEGATSFPRMELLEELDLDACRIQAIHDDAFQNLPNLKSLSLRRNVLYNIPPAVVLPSLVSLAFEGLDEMFITGNRFEIEEKAFVARATYGGSWQSVMHGLRTFQITHCSMGALTAEMFIGLENLTHLVMDYSDLPSIEPGALSALKGLRELSLACSTGLNQLTCESLAGPEHLEVLDMTNIRIFPDDDETLLSAKAKHHENSTFPLAHIRVLNLTGALINMNAPLEYLALSKMPFLEVLNVSQNRLTQWTERRFAHNPLLHTLEICRNHDYINITDAMILDFANLKTLDLRENNFFCNGGVTNFYALVQTKPSLKVRGWKHGAGYECLSTKGVRKTFAQYAEEGLVVEPGFPSGETVEVDYKKIVIPVLCGSTFIIILAVVFNQAYNNRWYIQYYLAKHKIRSQRRRSNTTTFTYDAFVSYNHVDKDFVWQHLLPMLEDGGDGSGRTRLRLCVHERDFRVGCTIMENIVHSLESSRACIVVLSKEYARSEWCCFEAQMALHLFQEDEREKTIVVIVRNKMPGKDMNKTLKTVVSLRTYLEWGDQPTAKSVETFSKRLRFALNCASEEDVLNERA